METTAASGIEPNWSLLRRLMERAPSLGWRASGLWALDVLEDRLGAEWPAKFGNKPSGIPAEIAWAAGHTGAFTWLMELALRLHILGEATGMAAVRKGLVTDLREESLRHACLQLEVATLALRGGWDVALECHLPDATSPVDVSLKRGDQAFGVEAVALKESHVALAGARDSCADCMVTPCPLCHLAMDAYQRKAETLNQTIYNLPVLHLPQLLGLALGLSDTTMRFERHMVPTSPVREIVGGRSAA